MIHVVGAGFLGSIFLEEFFKRQFALEMDEPMRVHDFDTFEERNCANQNVTRQVARGTTGTDVTAPKSKAEIMAELGKRYDLQVEAQSERIEEENAEKWLDGARIIVSAVDNYDTRKLLWDYALGKDIPIMHLGIAQDGTGSVEWSWGQRIETWPLSPAALAGKPLPDPKLVTLLPCDLVGLRGLGLNTSLAAAKALGLLYGIDPENYFPSPLPPNLVTVWASSNHNHKMVEATSFEENDDGKVVEVPQAAR